MRKYIVILLGLFLWSCSQEKMPLYNGKTCIYFNIKSTVGASFTDEMNFSFGLLNVMDSVLQIPVMATGDLVDYDRYFDFVMDSTTATEGVHFELPEKGVIPAGKEVGYIAVPLHRIVDDEEIYQLHLRLLPNETFELNLPEAYVSSDTVDLLRMTLNFSSSITKPRTWMDSWFGYFSVAKYNTFCEICGKDASYWEGTPNDTAHIALGNVMWAYVEQKMLEGPEAALRDPSNKQEKGYMTMRGMSGYMKVPDSWPDVSGEK